MLMHRVDDISLGISGPADTLLLSSRAGDPLLLSEQSKSLTELASSLHSIAEDAMEGWVVAAYCEFVYVCMCVCTNASIYEGTYV